MTLLKVSHSTVIFHDKFYFQMLGCLVDFGFSTCHFCLPMHCLFRFKRWQMSGINKYIKINKLMFNTYMPYSQYSYIPFVYSIFIYHSFPAWHTHNHCSVLNYQFSFAQCLFSVYFACNLILFMSQQDKQSRLALRMNIKSDSFSFLVSLV